MFRLPARRNGARALLHALALCCSFSIAALAAVPSGRHDGEGESQGYRQIDPREQVAAHFTRVSKASLAIVAVPDPRVPRHRRAYDLSIVALIQGMLDAGYVLDRYSFPWEQVLRETERGKSDTARPTDDCQYGLMIFRRDAWRQASGRYPELRALYLVPETNTYGLPRGTMFAAMREMAGQVTGREVDLPAPWCRKPVGHLTTTTVTTNTLASTITTTRTQGDGATAPRALNARAAVSGRTLLAGHGNCEYLGEHFVLLGPNFSGSLDSLAQVANAAARAGLPPICAVSASATATSNRRIAGFPQPQARALEFHSLAVSDSRKLASLWATARTLKADEKIAILAESSMFGHEICRDQGGSSEDEVAQRLLCAHAVKVSFPANIADVRAGLRARKAEASSELRKLIPQESGLPLEDGAGNGSELPYSLQARLTATGNEMELRKAIRMLSLMQPRMIIVVATDIRDRLFLFDMLREGVPYAQLVDVELDQLMAHPEYMHASRGALLVGSTRTTSAVAEPSVTQANSYAFSSTDYQVLLRRIVGAIDAGKAATRPTCSQKEAKSRFPWDPRAPVLHVVGRQGIVTLDCLRSDNFWSTSFLAPLFGLGAIILLMAVAPAMQSLVGHSPLPRERPDQADKSSTGHRRNLWSLMTKRLLHWVRRHIPIDDPSLNHTFPMLVIAFALLILAAKYGGGRSTVVMTMLSAPPLCWALAYQAALYRRNSLKSQPLPWNRLVGRRFMRHWLSLLALTLLASVAGWWIVQELEGDPQMITMIGRFAYRADQGLAIGTAMTLAVLGLVFADNTLAVARNASERNHFVVREGLWPRSEHARINCHLRAIFNVSPAPRSAVMAVGLMALVLCVFMALPMKVALFGWFLSLLALVAVTALSLVALAFLANAIRLRRRTHYLTDIVRAYARVSSPEKDREKEEGFLMGRWKASEAVHVRFASTPATARLKDAGDSAMRLLGPTMWLRFAEGLAMLRCGSWPFDERARTALYVLFASEVSQMRWATFSSATCCLAVAAFVYLFPVSGANGFVLFAVGLLMVNGLFAGFVAMSMERNEVLSNILCNRTSKVEFSGALFNYIAFPFVILAVSLAIVQVPGVLTWSEGLFQSALDVARGRVLE